VVVSEESQAMTGLLAAIEQGDPQAAEQLLPLVYDELRKLAARKLAREKPGQTLQATALVHEAFLRLVDGDGAQRWENRRHFFAAAAEAMRRILIENARRKRTERHGGGRIRVDLDEADLIAQAGSDELLDLDEAVGVLAEEDPEADQLVKLRLFAGLSVGQAAEVLGISRVGPPSGDRSARGARSSPLSLHFRRSESPEASHEHLHAPTLLRDAPSAGLSLR
jgi:RNA polymerase sigma factor (TIGR02999 family)